MIILLGKPGTGKSTQSKLLAKNKNYGWVSTGEILRKSLAGHQLERITRGLLLSDDEMIKVLSPVLKKMVNGPQFILDGFPRTIPQAKWLIEETKAGRLKPPTLINIELSDNAAKKRLLNRGRADDSKTSVEKRYEVYNRLTAPMIELFKHSGLEVQIINGDQTPEKVQNDILAAIK